MEDLTGRQLGSYQIVAPLGEGGMAAVYKAYQPGMERYVALKILPRKLAEDPEFVGRFNQEAKVLAKLQHPHILPVFDFGEADGYTYIVMPFVESGTLASLLRGQPLPVKQIRSIISQIGGALNYAHSHGLVHRDVKPSNVLIDETGNCLLTDFGIAKIVEGTAKFTSTGAVIGTPAYMSPEQGRGEKLDGRSDIYSLGIILYEMATGRVPFQAETPVAIIFKHISDPLPMPRATNPALPESVERVILKALAKSAEDRFQTAGEMVEALEGITETKTMGGTAPTVIESASTLTHPTKETGKGKAPTGRRRRVSPIAMVAALVAVAGIICASLWAVSVFLESTSRTTVVSTTTVDTTPTGNPDATAITPLPVATEIPAFTASPTPVEPVTLQYEQDGMQAGVARDFAADVWSGPQIGNPGVNGDRQTQLVMGERVLILEESDLWYRIVAVEQPSSKDSRGYPGWVQKSDIVAGWPIAREYAIVTEPTASLFNSPGGALIEKAPFDARLPVLEGQSQWAHVYLPGGRDGWLSLNEARITNDLSALHAMDQIVSTSRKFIGAPYLWGGTTAQGFDCSGFLYRVFHAHGIALSRDSRDMATNGLSVSLDSLQAGDLVFTSSRPDGIVSHTALYIGDGQVIETVGTSAISVVALPQLLGVERYVSASRVIPR